MTTETLSKRELRKREIQSRILRNAYSLFVAKGFEATTVAEIIQESSVSKRTFFSYFPAKTDLLAFMAGEMSRITRRKACEIGEKNWKFERKIKTYFSDCMEETQNADEFAKILLRYSFSSMQPSEGKEMAIEEGFVELLKKSYDKGELDSKYSIEMLAQMVHGIFASLILSWINGPDYPLASRSKQAAELAIKAIKAPE